MTPAPHDPAAAIPDAITPDAIAQAADRIAADVRRTPCWTLPGAALGLPVREVVLKLEHLQRAGSFKARGMFNRLRVHRAPAAGVVIASGGNAGIAVAEAARALGVRCEVFVPELASQAKRDALAALGARVVVGGAAYADALAACEARQAETGALAMHAYDQPEVVAGAGTLAREIEADAGLPDRVLVSVGGGGLIAGVAAWFDGRTRVEALEPFGSPTLHAAVQAGEPVDVAVGGLAADALGARRIGSIAWAVQRRGQIAATHRVPDAAIADAQRRMWRELRLAVEPAAALPLAALWAGVVQPRPDERVAVVVCGANLDPGTLAA